jgi:hypothetical protein
MSRRLLITLLSALALLLAAAPAALAAPAQQTSPLAAAAVDDAPTDEGACSDDPEVELPACTDGWEEGGDGDAELCEADLSEEYLHASAAQEGEEWSEEDPGAGEEEWVDDACEPLAPAISALAAAVSGRGARTRVRVTFTLDGPGEVELTLARVEEGVTRGGRCAAVPAARGAKKAKNAKRNGKRSGKKCTRTVELRGSVVVDGDEGANATELRRRWGGRALAAGRYELTATPLDDGDSATTGFALALSGPSSTVGAVGTGTGAGVV